MRSQVKFSASNLRVENCCVAMRVPLNWRISLEHSPTLAAFLVDTSVDFGAQHARIHPCAFVDQELTCPTFPTSAFRQRRRLSARLDGRDFASCLPACCRSGSCRRRRDRAGNAAGRWHGQSPARGLADRVQGSATGRQERGVRARAGGDRRRPQQCRPHGLFSEIFGRHPRTARVRSAGRAAAARHRTEDRRSRTSATRRFCAATRSPATRRSWSRTS